MRQHSQIIDVLSSRCGGQAKLAAAIGVADSAIDRWKTAGVIPRRHWSPLARFAGGIGITLDLEANEHWRIIEQLAEHVGSQIGLAVALGVDTSRISKWKNGLGIPPRHWPRLLKIAQVHGIALTLEDLEDRSPLSRKLAA